MDSEDFYGNFLWSENIFCFLKNRYSSLCLKKWCRLKQKVGPHMQFTKLLCLCHTVTLINVCLYLTTNISKLSHFYQLVLTQLYFITVTPGQNSLLILDQAKSTSACECVQNRSKYLGMAVRK